MGKKSDAKQLSHAELRKVYEADQNVLRFCKEKLGADATNEQAAILHSYELQAGSYVKLVTEDPEQRAIKEQYGRAIASVLETYSPMSVLEAGVGEATTLAEVVKNLPPRSGQEIYAFDLSWSRVLVGKRYYEGQANGRHCRFFVGELEHIALPDNSFDVVFTSHAIEPNHGREEQILQELYRVTAGQLVLLEPAYELASESARERMNYHGYCRGLKEIAVANGWTVSRCELFGNREDTGNPTMILEISKGKKAAEPIAFVSPVSGGALELHQGHYFNQDEGLVFPVLGEIPHLTRSSAILASHYLQA